MTALNQTLNLDPIESRPSRAARPAVNAPLAASDGSDMFVNTPVYARTPKRKASNNLPLLVGAPVLLVAAGAMAWVMMASPAQTPAGTEQPAEMPVVDSAPLTTPVPPAAATPAPIPTPFETAAVEAPAPRATAPVRTAAPRVQAVRRAAPVQAAAPDASAASSNVSATVPAAPTVIVAEPAPLVIPAPVAPAPTPEPVTPMVPQ